MPRSPSTDRSGEGGAAEEGGWSVIPARYRSAALLGVGIAAGAILTLQAVLVAAVALSLFTRGLQLPVPQPAPPPAVDPGRLDAIEARLDEIGRGLAALKAQPPAPVAQPSGPRPPGPPPASPMIP